LVKTNDYMIFCGYIPKQTKCCTLA
jgi:hypothetical protein